MQEVPYIPLSLSYTKVKILFQPITSSITYHHPGKDNAGIQIKAHERTEVSTGDNISFKAGNHSFMQVKL